MQETVGESLLPVKVIINNNNSYGQPHKVATVATVVRDKINELRS